MQENYSNSRNDDIQTLKQSIDTLRIKLYHLINNKLDEKENLVVTEEVIRLSCELDHLIALYNKKRVKNEK